VVLERFWLAYPSEWLAKDGLNQIQHTEANSTVGLDPITKILAELRVKHSLPRSPRSFLG
jgi:hypothetical protein